MQSWCISVEFQPQQVGKVGWAQLILDASDIAGFLEKWGAIIESSPRDLTSFLIINPHVRDSLHHYFSGLYPSFDTDLRPERLQDAFPPKNLERLRELKARYDPGNVFRDNINIAPQLQKERLRE